MLPQKMPFGKVYWAMMAFLSLFIFSQVSFADPSGEKTPESQRCIRADEQFEFAEHYFSRGDYDRAGDEFERFVYFFPEDSRGVNARYEIGKSRFAAGQFDKAKAAFVDLIKAFPKTGPALKAHVDLSRCYMKLNDPDQAIKSLEHLIFISSDPDMIDPAWYETGWIFVDTANWDLAKSSFSRISSKNKADFEIENLVEELQKAQDIPKKNPRLAGFLSVVPGSGYLYCGRPKDALTAFLLNGGLIWAAVSAFENDNPALGAVVGFVESGFYAGNIYGGISSAHKYNKSRTQNFIEKLKSQNKINLTMNFETKQIGLLFETEF
jgi:tetratricopeptide (TPR) repeat protein